MWIRTIGARNGPDSSCTHAFLATDKLVEPIVRSRKQGGDGLLGFKIDFISVFVVMISCH